MANTAALLGNLLCKKADINYYTQQQMFWSGRYESNAAKLKEQVKLEEKWYSAYDSCLHGDSNGNQVKYKETTYAMNETDAEKYANIKVDDYDQDLSEELAELDVEYSTMQTMFETFLEAARAEKDATQTATSNAAADTGILNAG